MRFERPILEAFERLRFTPRPGQVEAVDQILSAFIIDGAANVVLSAPTGAGKSIIGLITAEALTSLRRGDAAGPKSSILLTATNALAEQYAASFQVLAAQGKILVIKGAANYDCAALSVPGEAANGESCAFHTMLQHQAEFETALQQHCDRCAYRHVKQARNLTRHLTTNYSYYFIDRMYVRQLEPRDLVVWDEAHLLNDLFCEHNSIFFSQQLVQRWAQEIADTVQLTDPEVSKILATIHKDLGTKDKINERNYRTYLIALLRVYRYAKGRGAAQQERALRAGELGRYGKLTRFVRAYEGRACKIDDLFRYEYEHVFEYKEAERTVSVKPIFVGNMLETLRAADHNLFMSATLSGEFLAKTLSLPPAKTRFIKLPPSFPKENKEIVIFDPLPLSHASLQDPEIVNRLVTNVVKVVRRHTDQGERGIILTPSFKLQQAIVAGLPRTGFKLFEQRRGERLEHVLSAFKGYQGGPAVLISPSLFEGIDLPGDLSRFQVLVKAPFPSLEDKRMRFILDRHPDLYNVITLMKIIQGAGRSVRAMDDRAVTYILDAHAQRLFNSRFNVWKDEFNLRFTRFL